MTPAGPSWRAGGMVKVAVVPVVLMVTSAAGTLTPPPWGRATTMRVLAGSKLVPVRVTGVPPAVGPLLGVRLVVVGGGGGM